MPRTVLVVDDDSAVRMLLRELLEEEGYCVLEAEDGVVACEVFERQGAEIDLVVLDMLMPRLDGADTYARLRGLDPKVRVLVTTGFSRNDSVQAILENGARGFIRKPYRIEDLLEAVQRAIAS